MATPQPSPPIARIVIAETTPEKTSTEPIDRSMPDVEMTKVMPTARIARIEAFWRTRRKLDHCANVVGARAPKISTITRRTRKIWKACARRSLRTKPAFGSVRVPMATVSVRGAAGLLEVAEVFSFADCVVLIGPTPSCRG
ncbi:hypothetical protein [Microbacterium sp. SCN 71-21]|uniref:hypothetical protein n=1 Tax=Microbacterium sp. SCN 71-21 TaxID=1660116 RepID=UPI002583D805|nr:hypothetical protein [Microbacterium sp. SCN 71-21]